MKKRDVRIIAFIMLMMMAFGTFYGCSKQNGKVDDGTGLTLRNPTYDYTILVNKKHRLPSGWEDTLVLVKATNDIGDAEVAEGNEYIRDKEFEVETWTYDAFKLLQAALKEEGIIILIDNAYRSFKRQQEIWNESMEIKGEKYTKLHVEEPGCSEHETGFAIDICIVKDGKIITDKDELLAEKEIFAKIHARLEEFGFILRYPEGKEDITGCSYEPWHFRYVRRIAGYLNRRNWTLEEFAASPASN